MEIYIYYILVISIVLFVYNYFIYPLCIIVLSRIYTRNNVIPVRQENNLPSVSIIIAAFNEEKVISGKLQNTIGINYPRDKLEIIVVSDGSNDKTESLVKEFGHNVISMHKDERNGKSAAINRAANLATGEILVLSDANNDFNEDAILSLTGFFANHNVGAVTGAKHIYTSDDRQAAQGDGLYWKYESSIKEAQSLLGSITAAEGEILAIRKSLYKPIDESLINDDAAITFNIVKSGYRIIYDKNAKSFEQASKSIVDDYYVKVRMVAGGFQSVSREFSYLFPPRCWFSFNYLSHKILRWFAPHFLVLILFCSFLLSSDPYIFVFLMCQLMFYGLSVYGYLNISRSKLPAYLYIPMYFTVMNVALFHGFMSYILGRTAVNWRKADR